jgi:hypothetical protein
VRSDFQHRSQLTADVQAAKIQTSGSDTEEGNLFGVFDLVRRTHQPIVFRFLERGIGAYDARSE